MDATTTSVKVVGPNDGLEGFLGSIGVRFMIDGAEAEERFSLVEHPMSPRALAAPLHLHTCEDEYSFVLEGRMGALLGEEVVEAGPGDLVFKPRNQWHTFWNAGDEPCRILEIISPAGFERFFQELVANGGVAQANPETFARSGSATASKCSQTRFRSWSNASGSGWASRSPAAGGPSSHLRKGSDPFRRRRSAGGRSGQRRDSLARSRPEPPKRGRQKPPDSGAARSSGRRRSTGG